jgi:alpha-beta hydrolase superfamily lysophospholipase
MSCFCGADVALASRARVLRQCPVAMQLIAKTYWAGAPFNFRGKLDTLPESLVLRAADFRQHRALYWAPPRQAKPKTAVVCIHPRVDFTHHYSFPRLLAAGIACLGANTRSPNNDTDTVHEEIAHDVGSCVRFLREQKQIEHVVLLGNSGGGSLAALYQAQAERKPADRISAAPCGSRVHLADAEMLPADALLLVSAHRGQGQVLLDCIDPSVSDESNPLSLDASLDMYALHNGFRPPPEWSEYSADFSTRYRAAQRARVQRLDDHARELIQKARAARPDSLPLTASFEERQRVERQSVVENVMVVHRSMANLNYVARHLDPSARDYGSLLSDRPDLMNYRFFGFARTCTPRAWLSTWSGLSSNADLCRNLKQIAVPTFVAHAGADREIYPSDLKAIFEASASSDKTLRSFDTARHYFEPDFGEKTAPDVELLMDALVPWLLERFEV